MVSPAQIATIITIRVGDVIPTSYLSRISEETTEVYFNALWPNPLVSTPELATWLSMFDDCGDLSPASTRAHELVQDLQKSRLLFDASNTEQRLLEDEHLAWRARALRGELVRTLILNTDTRCNLACRYCNVGKAQQEGYLPPPAPMSWAVAKRAIDQFLSLPAISCGGVGRIVFFGGEPLLNPDIVFQSLDYLDRLRPAAGLYISINTNGLLLNDEFARRFAASDCTVAISLDGPASVNDHYRADMDGRPSFAAVATGLATARRHGCRTAVLTTLHADSFAHLEELVSTLRAHQVGYWGVKLPTFADWSDPIYRSHDIPKWVEQLLDAVGAAVANGISVWGLPQRKFAACDGIGRMLSVEPNGDVYPCPGGIRTRLGNVREIGKIYRQPAYLRISERTLANLPACRRCSIAGYCAGGCAADVERTGATLFGHNPLVCRFQRAFVAGYLSRLATRPKSLGLCL